MSITKDNHPIIPQLYFIVLICGTLSHFFLNGFSIYTIQLHISAIFCLLFVLFFNRKSGTTISFTLVDLFIVIIGLFLLVNNLLKEGINVKSIHEYLCVLVIYFTIKGLVKKDENKISLLIALLIPGLLNNIISWSQFFDLIESNNHFFRFTGFFNNPGPSAIFSGINFLLCFLLLNNLKEKNNRLKLFIFINLVLGFPVLVLSESRATWLSIVIICLYYLNKKYSWSTYVSRMTKIVSGLVFTSLAIYGLYWLKPESVRGRLLIWEISIGLIKKNPFFGVGLNKFKTEFGYIQASYFSKVEDSNKILLADKATYAFNEYLQILIENGIIGLLFFLLLICYLFIPKKNNENLRHNALFSISLYCIIHILICSLFSYPLRISEILLYLIIFISIASSFERPISSINIGETKIFFIGMFLMILIPHAFSYQEKQKKFMQAKNLTLSGQLDKSFNLYKELEDYFIDDEEFLLFYGNTLMGLKDDAKAISIFKSAMKVSSDPMLFCNLGKLYERNNKIQSAIEAYMKAGNIIPNRLYPKYLLLKLYYSIDKLNEAKQISEIIINFPVKVPSQAVYEIKDYAEKINYELKNNIK